MPNDCPLCRIVTETVRINVLGMEFHYRNDDPNEMIFYKDDIVTICRTKNLKGHKERIMVIYNHHSRKIEDWMERYAISKVLEVAKQVFNQSHSLAEIFVVMDSTFASIKDHWHLVVTDLDPKTLDFQQMMKTKWVLVAYKKDRKDTEWNTTESSSLISGMKKAYEIVQHVFQRN